LRGDIGEKQILAYAGRPISASPAVGYASKHLAQQQQLVADTFAAKLESGEMVTAH
jgi:2-oxoglutarate dehydrogenase E1 component